MVQFFLELNLQNSNMQNAKKKKAVKFYLTSTLGGLDMEMVSDLILSSNIRMSEQITSAHFAITRSI